MVNIFPQLGGKSASDSYSLQAGYTVGYHRVTNIFNANWNREQQPHHQLLHQHHRRSCRDRWHRCAQRRPPQLRRAQISLSKAFTGSASTQPSFSHLADHFVLRDAELDSRQAQHALRRRLPPRAPRLPGRLQRHRKLHLHRPVHRGLRRQRMQTTGSSHGGFSARVAAVHHPQLVAGQELPARQRLSTPTPWTTGACCHRSR